MSMALAVALLTAAGDASGRTSTAYPLDCAYTARGGELEPRGPCARMVDDVPQIDPAHLAVMTFSQGLAEVRIATAGIAYVRRDGRAAIVFTFDNGADAFKQGLVRGLRHGKLIYYDRRLRPQVVTRYDWGYPFDHGRAKVGTDCKTTQADPEHSTVVCARWAVIDRRGREIDAAPGGGSL